MTLKQKKHIIGWIMRMEPGDAWRFIVEIANCVGWGRRYRLLEPVLARDSDIAVSYASYCIQDRFKMAEPVIAKNAVHAGRYACAVLKKRWLKAENLILNAHLNKKDVLFWRYEYMRMMQKHEGLHDEVRD